MNICSLAGRNIYPTMCIHVATKFAVERTSDARSKEMRRFDVRVIIAEPGVFAADSGKNATVINIGAPYAALEHQLAWTMKDSRISAQRDAARTVIARLSGKSK